MYTASSSHPTIQWIQELKKIYIYAEEVQFQQNLYHSSLSLSRLSTLPTREQHSKFFYSYSYQIPLPTCKQLNHVIWNHQKDKTQTTKTILPPSNVGKNDKLTPRYFCTSSSFKDCLIYCLNIFQCYCPVKDKTLSKHHKTTEPQIFQTVLIIS